jgi:hypothetical protein
MEVHHDDSVLALKGGLGRAHPNAGRIVAVVAKGQSLFLRDLHEMGMHLPGEKVLKRGCPYPLYFLLGIKFRDIVDLVANINALLHYFFIQGLGIHGHGPALGVQGLALGPVPEDLVC